ncbi:MAG: alpha/beta hydrolase [Deltaproteobacteria bacterium]|nr:alpha/beta hydrolase [Deltaproteobacteria bacterium]
MLPKRIWLWLLCLIVIVAFVWIFTAPIERYFQFREFELWNAGYERIEVQSPFGAFHCYIRGSSSNRTPLILVHGLGACAEYWTPFMKSLPEDRPVVSMELLGFGRSIDPDVQPQDYTMSLYLRQLTYLQERLHWPRPVLVGVSLGGWIAVEHALHYPRRTSGLCLIAPGGLDSQIPVEELTELRKAFDFSTPEEYRKLINERILTTPRWIPEFVAHAAVDRASRGGHHAILRNLRPDDWVGDRITELNIPIALIWGKRDRVFSFQSALRIQRKLSRARLFPIENSGHSYLMENREETIGVLREALDWLLKEIDEKKATSGTDDLTGSKSP